MKLYLVKIEDEKQPGRQPPKAFDIAWTTFTSIRRARHYSNIKRRLGHNAMLYTVTKMELVT